MGNTLNNTEFLCSLKEKYNKLRNDYFKVIYFILKSF